MFAAVRPLLAVTLTWLRKPDTSASLSNLNNDFGGFPPACIIFHLLPGSPIKSSRKRTIDPCLDANPSDTHKVTALQVSVALCLVISVLNRFELPSADSHSARPKVAKPRETAAMRIFKSMCDLSESRLRRIVGLGQDQWLYGLEADAWKECGQGAW